MISTSYKVFREHYSDHIHIDSIRDAISHLKSVCGPDDWASVPVVVQIRGQDLRPSGEGCCGITFHGIGIHCDRHDPDGEPLTAGWLHHIILQSNCISRRRQTLTVDYKGNTYPVLRLIVEEANGDALMTFQASAVEK